MTNIESLTVVLLTRNRNSLAALALRSLINQDFSDFHLVISDNSDNDSFQKIAIDLCSDFKDFSYIKRTPVLSQFCHFKQVLSEIKSDYFVLFHDDDIAKSNYLSSLISYLSSQPDVVAVACNAIIINGEINTRRGMFISNDKFVKIQSAEDLVLKYFSLDGHGCAPYPSYMYKNEVIKIFLSSDNIGKHNDFLWLILLFKLGNIVWISEKLIEYRVHELSDSARESLGGRLAVLGFLKKNFPNTVNRYRFIFYIKICANYRQNSLFKNFYLSKPSVKKFIYKQFINEFLSGSIILWLIYKVKKLIQK